METMTSDQKTLIPEIRVTGNRFTVTAGARENVQTTTEAGPATDSPPAGTIPKELTGTIPRHVWG
jgi:hypothetical protein